MLRKLKPLLSLSLASQLLNRPGKSSIIGSVRSSHFISGEHIVPDILQDPVLFAEIQTMETYGDFGSKIQALVRHLAYLKLKDPGAKSIIFSAWADSLHSMEQFSHS